MHARNGHGLALYIGIGTDPYIPDTPPFHVEFDISPALAGYFTPMTLDAIFLCIQKSELLL